jgi:hypothetical protein
MQPLYLSNEGDRMSQDLDKIRQTKKAAEADLLNRPGVIGVDVGYRYVGGEKTDEIVIRVHVAEKKDVSPDQKIPETINGVKTDVLQNRVAPVADDSVYSTVLGGIGIGPFRMVEGNFEVGTLGAIVVDKSSNKRMLLTNYHVACLNDDWKTAFMGKSVMQPYHGNFLVSRGIGDIERAELGDQCDAAVASLKDSAVWGDVSKSQYLIQDIGPVTGVPDPTLPDHGLRYGLRVRKRGRTTGLTFGSVDSLDYTGKFTYKYGVGEKTLRNQFTIDADKKRNTRFADAGDSGSVIVNEAGQVIGLLIATNANPDGSVKGTVGYATPINIVLDKLGVRMGTVAPNQVLIGDVNGDGKADLVWNWLGDQNLIFAGLAQANNIFKILPAENPWSELEQRWSGYRAFIGDVDGDGKADLVWNYLGSDINRIYVGLSQGNGNFQFVTPQDHPVRGGWSGYQLLIGDVNGDGKADLVWNGLGLGGDTNRIYVGLSQRYGIFDFLPAQDHPSQQLTPRWGGHKVLIGDVDGDGKADLVWNSPGDINIGATVYVGFSQGNGKFQLSASQQLYLVRGGWSGYTPALIGDVNGDGKADLVWNYLGSDINRIYVGLSQGNNKPYPNFQVQTSQDHPVRGGWSGYQLLIGDVNGDGKADLVWNSLSGDINRIYVGLSQAKPDSYSTFEFLPAQDHPVRGGWSGYQLLIGDVNGDGKADLVWNSLGDTNRIYVGLSQGNGKFQFLPAQDRGGVSS